MAIPLWFPTAADAKHLQLFDKSVYDDNCLTVAQWSRLLSNPTAAVVAAGSREDTTAVAVLLARGSGWFDLLRLGVADHKRRQGIATSLVNAIADRGSLRLRLRELNYGGLRAATAAGFVVTGLERGGFRDCDAVELERERNPAVEIGANIVAVDSRNSPKYQDRGR